MGNQQKSKKDTTKVKVRTLFGKVTLLQLLAFLAVVGAGASFLSKYFF